MIPPMIGQSLGSYTITAKIGEGGMGTVWLAEHLQIGRKVAIKVLLPEFAQNTNIVQRFFNEAKATSAIKHPGIVEVYDFGHTPQGSPYIVMEFLEGEPLQKRLERDVKIPPPAAVDMMRQIAEALGAAHAVGIVHRDLKPENIFLLPDRRLGVRVKLLDFGIAKLDQELRGDLDPTRAGAVLGTPQYMSPEQCTGSTNLDRRADMYALGCVLFHMLCGRPPFTEQEFGKIAIKHLTAAPPKPSVFEPTVSPELEAIVLKLLEKEPDNRYQLCGQLVDVLDGKTPRAASTPGPNVLPPGARTFVPGEMGMMAKDLPANKKADDGPKKRKTAILDKKIPPPGAVVSNPTPAPTSGPVPMYVPSATSGPAGSGPVGSGPVAMPVGSSGPVVTPPPELEPRPASGEKGIQPVVLIAIAAGVLAIFIVVALLSL